jgi:hypothetical protein
MRIVTYNLNGITVRLPNLLRWLDERTSHALIGSAQYTV